MVDAVILTDKWALEARFWLEFQTTIQTLLGGYEDRNQDWPTGLWHCQIELKNRPLSEIQTFINLEAGRRGAARAFLVKHPVYHTLTDENIGTGDGVTAAFQARQLFTDTVNPYYHYWYSLTNLVVKVAGVTKVLTTDYTETDGLITFGGGDIPSAAQAVTISCNPYIRMRFAEDGNQIILPIGPGVTTPFASTGSVHLMEVRQ
jgi:uncharacterized protein (TIGR02217 family)